MRAGTAPTPGTAAAASAGRISAGRDSRERPPVAIPRPRDEHRTDYAEHERARRRRRRPEGRSARWGGHGSCSTRPPRSAACHGNGPSQTPTTTTRGERNPRRRDRWAAATARPRTTATIPATGDARNASPAAAPARPTSAAPTGGRPDGRPGRERHEREAQLARQRRRDVAERRRRRRREHEIAAVAAEAALEGQ